MYAIRSYYAPAAAVLLPRLVGRQRALDVVLSGRTFEGADAVRAGLASQALPDEDFATAAERYAHEVACLSRPVLRLAKRAVREGETGPMSDAMRRVERLYLDDLMRLPDAREGLAAFMEKRPPVWEEARS